MHSGIPMNRTRTREPIDSPTARPTLIPEGLKQYDVLPPDQDIIGGYTYVLSETIYT